MLNRSKKLYKQAQQSLVGGVNSPVRSFSSVGGNMLFAKKAKGANIWDVDGNQYIDYMMSWGVGILGHAFKPVVDAAKASINNGSSFGLSTELEVRLAEIVKRNFRSIEKIRFVSSGTEACMSAVRLARAYTGRDKIIKFDGCYHGHFDGLLVKSGSGNLTLGIPSGKGILKNYTEDTISIPFNDMDIVENVVKKNKGKVAGIILEAVPCNTGLILPNTGYLKELQAIAKKEGILLIFDEVITGFRLSLGGAQKIYNIKPDLTCLGKIIGGGFPMAAYGGRKEIMDLVAPVGPVYQAGTLSGNPVAVTAGIKTLESIEANKKIYSDLEKKVGFLTENIEKAAVDNNVEVQINRLGSMFSVFFRRGPVDSYKDALLSDAGKYSKLFGRLLKMGILFPPSAYETCFVSTAHKQKDLVNTVNAFRKAFDQL